MSGNEWNDIFFTSRDGLRLYGRHYPAPGSTRRPVLCLPGLTRNCKDFHRLAVMLSDPRRHRRNVYCVDYRGRGRSEHDPDWNNYTPYIEALDVLDFMTCVGLHDAAIIGTSRGGILAMVMATIRPTAIGATVLNDIGPEIQREGLARIMGYVGRIPTPSDWREATQLVYDMNRHHFTNVSEDDWQTVARQWFNDDNDAPSASYDSNLGKSFSNLDLDQEVPSMWPQFQALSRTPLLTLRGENSDLLSQDTLQQMTTINPDMQSLTIKGQGHAPLLLDQPSIDAVAHFLAVHDNGAEAGMHMRAVA